MAAVPGADFYLILNSDALLRPGFFDALLAAARANPRAGLIAPGWNGRTGVRRKAASASPRPRPK